MQMLVWKLPYQNFGLSIHQIPPCWSLFWQLFQIKSVAKQTPYFLKVTEQADSIGTDLFLHSWVARSPLRVSSISQMLLKKKCLMPAWGASLLCSCCSLLLLVFLWGSSYASQMWTTALSTGDVTLACFCWKDLLTFVRLSMSLIFLWVEQRRYGWMWNFLRASPPPLFLILLFKEWTFCHDHYLLTHLFFSKSQNAMRRWTFLSLPLHIPWSQSEMQAASMSLALYNLVFA